MAEEDVFSNSGGANYIMSSHDFQLEVKNRLNWSKNQWAKVGEAGSRLNKLCNSLRYWKDKLKPALADESIVFTLFNKDKDAKTDLLQIITSIEKVDKNITVRGFSDFRNPRYLCVFFKNRKERDFIKENFNMVDNNYVVYLSWALEAKINVTTLKVHWIPINVDMDTIKQSLDKYVKCIEEERVILKFMSGREMPSGKASFKVTLNQGVEVDHIPHLMVIANMEALITIPGRAPLCLNCDNLGHISKKCKMRYCGVCESLKLKEHVCVTSGNKMSYAEVVRNVVGEEDAVDPDDWSAAFIVPDKNSVQAEKIMLENKIAVLENNLLNFDSKKEVEESGERGVGQDHKRKAVTLSDAFVGAAKSASFSDSSEAGSDDDMVLELDQSPTAGCLFSDIDTSSGRDRNNFSDSELDGKKSKNLKKGSKGKASKITKLDSRIVLGAKSELEQGPLKSLIKTGGQNSKKAQNKKAEKLIDKREFVFKD